MREHHGNWVTHQGKPGRHQGQTPRNTRGFWFCSDPRPVQDHVPDVDWHHIGSYPNGSHQVHEWIHRCTSGTHSPRLRHVYFLQSKSKDRRALDVNRFWTVTLLEVDVTFCVILDRMMLAKDLVYRTWTEIERGPQENQNNINANRTRLNYYSHYLLFYLL